MKEQLYIKNFGPISEATFEFRKYNFIIGDQASGKSTITKLLAIFKDVLVILGFITLDKKFTDFNLNNYFKRNTKIEYFNNGNYEIKYDHENKFSLKIKDEETRKFIRKFRKFFSVSGTTIDINLVQQTVKSMVDAGVYIPAERILVPLILENPLPYLEKTMQFPDFLISFGKSVQEARKEYSRLDIDWMKIKYSFDGRSDKVNFRSKTLKLTESASGFQNIVPLLLILEKSYRFKEIITYLIEEPEVFLFPNTQYALMKHIVQKIEKTQSSFVISTHSPYILSSINNLMYAFKVGKKNKEKAGKIVDSNLWVNPGDVTAVMLTENGKAENIIDKDIEQIAVEKIDGVSEIINNEYDELFNIEHGKK